MIDFMHADVGSIRCPYHNQRESFKAGSIIQPTNPALVRYPCGYVDGLYDLDAPPSTVTALLGPDRGELLQELSNRLKRLEERPYTRPTVPKMEPRPTLATTPTEPSILENYASPDK